MLFNPAGCCKYMIWELSTRSVGIHLEAIAGPIVRMRNKKNIRK